MLIQTFYGIATGSLGLLSDSIHMFFDCLALIVGLCDEQVASEHQIPVWVWKGGYSCRIRQRHLSNVRRLSKMICVQVNESTGLSALR